jgi:tRNA A37 threonylcarbamoyladenosine dehydratase
MEEKQRFGGVARLHGEEGYKRLQNAHVAVIGVGGVGSWVCEALARNAIGEITLIDADDVCVTNINRQIHALTETIGAEKIQAMAQRIQQINPECTIHCCHSFYMESTAEKLIQSDFDYVIDAIDSLKHKTHLIAHCRDQDIPLITVGGAGGKTQVSDIQVADLTQSHGDRLLSKVRSNLRKQYGFPKASSKGKNKKFNVPCVFSPEAVKMPWCDLPEEETRTSLKLDCNNGFGTDVTVISVFGLVAANFVTQSLVQSKRS